MYISPYTTKAKQTYEEWFLEKFPEESTKNISYKTLDEVAEKLNLPKQVLQDLTDSGHLPHYKIGDLVRYKSSEVKAYINSFLRKRCIGEPLPMPNVYVAQKPSDEIIREEIPDELARIEGLKDFDLPKMCGIPTCVYFLCLEGKVMYVGQSVNLVSRITTHMSEKPHFDSVYYIPVPRQNLNNIETGFIKALTPPWNGNKGYGKVKEVFGDDFFKVPKV